MSDWHSIFEKVTPHVVHISTPSGSGTGFFFAYNQNRNIAAFATASHVVDHADSWKLPIKLFHHESGTEEFLEQKDRIIFRDRVRDSASILIPNPGAYLPDAPLEMMDPNQFKKVGVEVAWAGYPAIAPPNLCLFTGTISAFNDFDDSYLIDGVAINGVSGGPLFASGSDGAPEVLGTISAYMPNRQPGDTLPGMMRAHDVTSFQKTISTINSFDQAAEKKEEEKEERRRAEASGEVPPDQSDDSGEEPGT